MKFIRNIMYCGAALLAIASCNKEYPYQQVTPIDTPATVSLVVDGLNGEVALMAPKTKTFTVKVEAKAIADELLTMTVKADPTLVDAYNKANNTKFEAVPAEAYELSKNQLLLPRYNKVSSTAEITLKSAALPEDGNAYLLPLTITEIKCENTAFDMTDADRTVYIQFRRKVLPASGYEFGSGTEADPYQIFTQLELLCMSKAVKQDQDTYFKLMENIDMTDCEDWVPASSLAPSKIHFDGNGKTITGFNSSAESYNSMFGRFTGSVKNLVFENPVLTSGNITSTGLIAAQIGNPDAPDQKTVISGVTVKGLKINTTSSKGKGDKIGGIAGSAINAEFSDIDIRLDVIDADENGLIASNVGGIAGICEEAPSTFTNCKVRGTLIGHHSTGGIVGYSRAEGCSYTGCVSEVEVSSKGNNTGGLIGYVSPNSIVKDCSATGNINGGGTLTGGLIGQVSGSTVEHCFATGNVHSKSHYTGGLIGGGDTGKIIVKKSYATGNVTSNKNHCGGLIGNMDRGGKTGGSLVEDCYSAGNVVAEGDGRMFGGLIGVIEKSENDVVRRCYVTGNVELTSTQVTCGGLVGIAKRSGKGTEAATETINFTMEKCIAWSKKIVNGNNPTSWSSGAFIGATSGLNTLTSNYRRADMELVDYGGVKLIDQEDVSSSAPLQGTDPENYKMAYHGKAAEAGATLTSVAKKLGWPEDVWDLSGDTPKIK